MNNNNILGLYIAFYLAKFNKEAYLNLGFKNQTETHKAIGAILGIKPSTIQNWRDEFDPLFGHRAGWYQRGLGISRIRVVEAIGNLDEPSLRSIVQDILSSNDSIELTEDIEQLISVIPDERKKKQKRAYVPRNITGRQAEEIFVEWFQSDRNEFPQGKNLLDMRDYGCGYDFQITISDKQVYGIEVKGISEEEGGILITGKEWETARKMGADYFLAIVSNVKDEASIHILNNPYNILKPKRNIQTVIQVSWSVSNKNLKEILM